ncbi:hypothetical protein HPB49_015852 [Dermacentor silvarum]|uniref:Uncharacterized protein n=1 Tax=Dermacentor silvarum TaxID=543639 RepID=A0ACB8CFT2_DERSI|nr:hypothetical protein HPB49_015852 [Dermacentor silvarum]
MCDFSGLDLEKMVDNIFRRVPASYSTPRDKPLQIIPEITIDAPVIKGLDKFELYGPVFSYCRNGAKLVQVDIVFDRLIELSATWKTCSGTEGVIGTYGTARVTVTFEVVNATREDGLQEKGMKLVLHGYPKAVGVDVVSVYIRGAEDADYCDFSGIDLYEKVNAVVNELPPEYSQPDRKPEEVIPGVFLGTIVYKGLDNLRPYGPVFSHCRNGTRLVQVDLATDDRLMEAFMPWKTCGGQQGSIRTYASARVTVTFKKRKKIPGMQASKMYDAKDAQSSHDGLLHAPYSQGSLALEQRYLEPDHGLQITSNPWSESADFSFTSSDGARDDSELKDRRTTITWFTILAVLGIALVSAVGSLLVNASWSMQGDADWATQPLLADEREEENSEAMVAAHKMLRGAAKPMMANVSLTRTPRMHRTSLKTMHASKKEGGASKRRMHHEPLSTVGPNHVCGRSFYTYCPVLHQEAYYGGQERRCLLTTTDTVRVCNRSPNRFASLDACYNACGRLHGPMADRCFEKTLFTDCDRQDVLHSWWVFSGKNCVRWKFPRGLCPDDKGSGAAVFANQSACAVRCLPSPKPNKSSTFRDSEESGPCRQPKAKSCTSEQLRFPYFADILQSGRGHCVRASSETMLMHRCLVGANRFSTVTACREACERRKI